MVRPPEPHIALFSAGPERDSLKCAHAAGGALPATLTCGKASVDSSWFVPRSDGSPPVLDSSSITVCGGGVP
jgi:hypothetical protein